MERLKRFRFWTKTRLVPWIKKNRIPLIISLIAIAVIVFFVVRWHMQAEEEKKRERQVRTEAVEGGITGAEVKKELLAWKSGDKKAIIVCEAAQMVYHYADTFQEDPYSVLMVDDKDIVNVATNEGGMMLWGINYGSVLKESVLQTDGDDAFASGGFMKKDKSVVTVERNGKKKKDVSRAKENPYTVKDGIAIPDDEIFVKKDIINVKYRKIGVMYYPEKIILPKATKGK